VERAVAAALYGPGERRSLVSSPPVAVLERERAVYRDHRRGHTNLGITSVYLQGIDNTEIIDSVHPRRALALDDD
jgi:hypothetical protein